MQFVPGFLDSFIGDFRDMEETFNTPDIHKGAIIAYGSNRAFIDTAFFNLLPHLFRFFLGLDIQVFPPTNNNIIATPFKLHNFKHVNFIQVFSRVFTILGINLR